MKSRTFEVPLDVISEFAEIMDDNDFDNVIEGVTHEGDIIVRVDYETAQRRVINEIHDLIDEYNDNREEEEEDGDDQENEDDENDEEDD